MRKKQTTKDLLVESIVELAQHTPVNKLSVSMICENCGVARRTFYDNFADKYELMNWVITSSQEQAVEQYSRDHDYCAAILFTMQRLTSLKDFVLNSTRHAPHQDSMDFATSKSAVGLYRACILSEFGIADGSEQAKRVTFLLKYHTCAVNAMVAEWIAEGMPEPVEPRVRDWVRAMPEELKPYLHIRL